MFRIFIALFLSSLLFFNCTSTKKPENRTPDTTVTEDKTSKPEKVLSKEDLPQAKPFTQGGDDQPSDNVLEFFATDFWLPQFAISGLDKEAHKPFMDMWLKFNKKGTFYGGINKDLNIKGSWKFDTKNNMLFIISDNKNLDGKWAIKRSGFTMVWLAREGQPLQDIQIKLVNSSYRPGEE